MTVIGTVDSVSRITLSITPCRTSVNGIELFGGLRVIEKIQQGLCDEHLMAEDPVY